MLLRIRQQWIKPASPTMKPSRESAIGVGENPVYTRVNQSKNVTGKILP